MGPGPSDIHPRVLSAMARPTVGHLDPKFIEMMEELKELLRKAFCTKNALTLPISAPGSAGMEVCFFNLLEEGEKVAICQNGVFGKRMEEVARRARAQPICIEDPWGRAVSPEKVEDTLKQHPDIKVLAFVHAETSTGAKSNAQALCEIARRYDCLTLVDAVTSLGGSPLKVDEWGIDAIYSGTQKCLSVPPGLSPVSFSDRAVEKVQKRKSDVQSWFLDLRLLMGYWQDQSSQRAYHHTAPVHALYALHEGLVMLHEEGLENAWRRHSQIHQELKQGLEAMGLTFIVPENERLPQLNAVSVPPQKDEAEIRRRLLEEDGLEIGAGLGPLAGKIWRIGLMGQSCTSENVSLCLKSIQSKLD